MYSDSNLKSALNSRKKDEDENEESHLLQVREKGSTMQRAMMGLFGVLSLMQKKKKKKSKAEEVARKRTKTKGTKRIYFVNIVNLMQMLAFSFNHAMWPAFVQEYFVPIVKVSNLTILTYHPSVAGVAFVGCLIMIIFTLVSVATVGYQFANDSVETLWVLPILSVSLKLLTTVLYVPVLAVLLSIYNCDNFEAIECHSGFHLFLMIFIGLLTVLFVALTSVSVLVLVERNPLSLAKNAQAHGRVDCAVLLLKFFLSVVLLLFRSVAIVKILAIIFVACGMVYVSWKYLPFYDDEVNRASVASRAVFFWSGICLLGQWVLVSTRGDDSDAFGVFLAFLAGAPFVAISAFSIVEERFFWLEKTDSKSLGSPLLAEVALRRQYPVASNTWLDVFNAYRDLVEHDYPGNGFLLLHIAMLMKEWGENHLLSSQYMQMAKDCPDLHIDERYNLFKNLMDEETRSAGLKGSTMTFMEFDHHNGGAEKRVIESMSIIYKIWDKLRSQTGCTEWELLRASERLRIASLKANFHLEELMRVTKRKSPQAMELYAVFLESVLNDKITAQYLREVMKEKQEEEKQEDDSYMLAALTISGREDNLGTIIDCSHEACKLFGLKNKADIVGQNISVLCPQPIARVHSNFIRHYLQSNSDFVTVSRCIWGLHRGNYVIPLQLEVTPLFDTNKEIVFSGVFRRDYSKSSASLAVSPDDYSIYFGSKRAYAEILEVEVPNANAKSPLNLGDFLEPHEIQKKAVQTLLKKGTDGAFVPFHVKGFLVSASSRLIQFVNRATGGIDAEFVIIEFKTEADEREHDEKRRDGITQDNSVNTYKSGRSHRSVRSYRSAKSGKSRIFQQSEIEDNTDQESAHSWGSQKRKKSVFGLVSAGLTQGEKRKQKYKRLCIFSTLLCLLLSLVALVNREYVYLRGIGSMQQIHDSSYRANLMVSTAGMFDVMSAEILNKSDTTFLQDQRILDNVFEMLRLLVSTHLSVTESTSYDEARRFNLNRTMTVSTVGEQTGETLHHRRVVNLVLGVNEFTSKAHNVLAYQGRSMGDGNSNHFIYSNMLYLANNGPTILFQGAMNATSMYLDGAVDGLLMVEMTDLVGTIGVTVFSILAIGLWIVPNVMTGWETQSLIIYGLHSIPRGTAKLLCSKAKERLEEAKTKVAAKDRDENFDDEGLTANHRVSLVSSIVKTVPEEDGEPKFDEEREDAEEEEEEPEDDSIKDAQFNEAANMYNAARRDSVYQRAMDGTIKQPNLVEVNTAGSEVESLEDIEDLESQPLVDTTEEPITNNDSSGVSRKSGLVLPSEDPSPNQAPIVGNGATISVLPISLQKQPSNRSNMGSFMLSSSKGRSNLTKSRNSCNRGVVGEPPKQQPERHTVRNSVSQQQQQKVTEYLRQKEFEERSYMAKHRKKRESKLYLWIIAFGYSLLFLGWPFIVTMAYFGFNAFLGNHLLQERIEMAHIVYTAGVRWANTQDAFVLLNSFHLLMDEGHIWYNDTESYFNFVEALLETSFSAHDALKYGNAEMGIFEKVSETASTSTNHKLMYDDVCMILDESKSCSVEFENHLWRTALKRGIDGAMNRFKDWSEEQLVVVENHFLGDRSNHTNNTFAQGCMKSMEEEQLFNEALRKSMQTYVDEFSYLVKFQLNLGRMTLAIYALILFWSGFVTYRHFENLDEKVSDLQYLLLMIPASTIRDTKELREIFGLKPL